MEGLGPSPKSDGARALWEVYDRRSGGLGLGLGLEMVTKDLSELV